MARDTQIPVAEFVQIRNRVAEELKKATPRAELSTRERAAEALILAGYIDIEAVRADLAPKPSHLTAGHPDTIEKDEN